ncbi:MAG: SRPBCC family protein [Chloroflexi bacterium]|nr:SRPBCC family protein [Chloroflexota bacterium]
MLFEQKFVAPAPREKAWDFLMDVATLAQCLPGVEKVETIDDTNYTGIQKVKIGPFSFAFNWKVTLTEMDHDRYTASLVAQGTDNRVASSVRARMSMSLVETSPQETEVRLTSDVSFMGKLGQLGSGLIRRKSEEMMNQFAANMGQRLK